MTFKVGQFLFLAACIPAVALWFGPDHEPAGDQAESRIAAFVPAASAGTLAELRPQPRPDRPEVEEAAEEAAEVLMPAAMRPTATTTAAVSGPAAVANAVQRGPVTNLPLPRYVSLKAAEGNVRRGPSLSHRIDWVFRHRDMPLRVTAEYGNWRRIEDRDGVGGWVHYALISGVRTVSVTAERAELRARPEEGAPVIAIAQSGAIGRLDECSRDWCRIVAGGQRGWLHKSALWGVDPDETLE